jgi:hypothetical protein
MWNNLTYGEWDIDHRTTSELYEVGQGFLMRLPAVPDHVRRRQQIASSYRASLRRSKSSARARLWHLLGTTLCKVRFWYAQHYEQEKMMSSPC